MIENIPGVITKDFLDNNPDCIFVFGDNLKRSGKKGAAILRDHPQAYGFITKRYPSNHTDSFYKVKDYIPTFKKELDKLEDLIKKNPDKTIIISKLGGGLANKFSIFENVVRPGTGKLRNYPNVKLLFGGT